MSEAGRERHGPAAARNTARAAARPPYAMIDTDDPRAVPAGSVAGAIRHAIDRRTGRTGLFAASFDRAYHRLIADPRARSLSLAFADAHFGRALHIEIDPQRLGTFLVDLVGEGQRGLRLAHWFLDGGDWSGATLPLRILDADREIAAILDETPWRSSEAYRFLLAQAERRRPEIRNGVALDTERAINAYFAYYECLIESVRTHGLLSRTVLPSAVAHPFGSAAVRGPGAEGRERDVGVAVGPDGELIRMVGGRHRTAIAQRLQLRRFPVQVRLVHIDWLGAQIASTGLRPGKALVSGIRSLTAGEAHRPG